MNGGLRIDVANELGLSRNAGLTFDKNRYWRSRPGNRGRPRSPRRISNFRLKNIIGTSGLNVSVGKGGVLHHT